MKKLMCVLILVAFLGSMVVMTGCFGGSDGLGILAGVLVIAIVASSGGAGGVAFAANTRASERPALIAASGAKRFIAKIKNAQGVANPADVTVTDTGDLKLDASVTADSSNGQYSVEIFPIIEATGEASDKAIYKHYFVKTVAAGATDDYTDANRLIASDTAKAVLYDNWDETNKPTIEKTSIAQAEIDTLSVTTLNELKTIPVNDDGEATPYTTAWTGYTAAVTGVEPTDISKLYSISGFVTKKDMTGGQDGAYVYAHGATNYSTTTSNGNYTLNVKPGTYSVYPSSEGHTYDPESKEVEVSDADVSGINFQAK